MITCEVNHARFDSAMDGLLAASKTDARDILIQQHGLLTKTIVNFTPPPKQLGPGKLVGDRAVASDLHSLVSEANQALVDSVASEYGITNVNAYRVDKSGDRINLQWDNIDWDGGNLESLHAKYRNGKGRVPKIKAGAGVWKSRVVVPRGMLDPYIKKVQKRVGALKAMWAYCASREPMLVQFPNYITNQFSWVGRYATAQIQLDGLNPSITFGGPAASAGPTNTRERVNFALKLRAKAIVNLTKLVISGYNKDVAAGIRPRAHAKEHQEQGEDVS